MTNPPEPRGATAAQLKHDIDSGRTGDKAPGFDPAAAPLGTDEEAGGAALSPDLIEQTRRAERGTFKAAPHPNAAEPAMTPDGRMDRSSVLIGVAIGAAAALIMAAVFVALG